LVRYVHTANTWGFGFFHSFNVNPPGTEDLRKTMVSYEVLWKAISKCQLFDA